MQKALRAMSVAMDDADLLDAHQLPRTRGNATNRVRGPSVNPTSVQDNLGALCAPRSSSCPLGANALDKVDELDEPPR